MSASEDQEREERALDVLIVLAFLLEGADDAPPPPDPDGPEPVLSPEHRAALDALGPDLVERIVRAIPGSVSGRARHTPRRARRRRPGLTGSMHRVKGKGKLTDEARAEMERKVRELEAEDNKEAEP
jgi:hypothetical protein